jgi:riboflavin kinase/FMN adenylyltransferase
LEVHIFDFDENIYGKYIEVDFIAKIRDEERFSDANSLINQMNMDTIKAKQLLSENSGE